MTSRVRVLCALLAALSLVATACPGGSDTDTTEFTGDEPPGDTLAAEAPGPATPDGVAPETAAVGRVEAEGTDPAAAPEPAADPAADALTPREAGVLRNFLGYEFPPAPD
ncbi:MAG: hypothetical protein F4Z64_00810, partial [Acidimicrobiaceae bacterium]|nr:hypothetical protein [Acidimicrobiaceae bacterium]MYE98517.1 hypothetical protein [Acidimicrobiaceae bacterium]